MPTDNLQWLAELANLIPEDELDRRIAELEDQLIELGQAREALRQLKTARLLAVQAAGGREVGATVGTETGVAVTVNGHRPSLREALRTVFREAEGGILSMDQIMDALAERQWLPDGDNPRKLVGASISGLVHKSHELVAAGRGNYRRAIPDESQERRGQ